MESSPENGFEPIQRKELPNSLELVHELEDTEDENIIKDKIGVMLDSISHDLKIDFVPEVNNFYKRMSEEGCLVRVERLSRVLETVEMNEPLSISDEDESHYANAVIPTPEGIKIAFSEGQAPGPVRVVVGFGKTIIGFRTESLSVNEIEFSETDFRDAQERKYLCRHVKGELKRDDIRYIIIRIPFLLMPEDHLSPAEAKKKPTFVFRGMNMVG